MKLHIILYRTLKLNFEIFSRLIICRTVDRLWSITEDLNILYKENWTRLAAKEVQQFQVSDIINLPFSLTLFPTKQMNFYDFSVMLIASRRTHTHTSTHSSIVSSNSIPCNLDVILLERIQKKMFRLPWKNGLVSQPEIGFYVGHEFHTSIPHPHQSNHRLGQQHKKCIYVLTDCSRRRKKFYCYFRW